MRLFKVFRHHAVEAQEKLEEINHKLQKDSIVTHNVFVKIALRTEGMEPFVISLPALTDSV